MRIGRPYLALLCLAIVALAVYLVVPKGGTSAPSKLSPAQLHSLEVGALRRLTLSGEFVPVHSGCLVAECYRVDRSATQVSEIMPGLLRSAGIQPPGALKAAEPVAMLRQGHWSTASRDPLVIACKTLSVSGTAVTMCQDAGRVGQTLINVLVSPDQPCHRPSCTDVHRSEVQAWATAFPLGS